MSSEIEVWIAMDEGGDYEVGCEEDSATERLEEKGAGISRRMVQLRVTMAPPEVVSVDVSIPDEVGQTVTVKTDI
jgi:hypothetical protein